MPGSLVPCEQKFSLAAEVVRSFGKIRLRVSGTSMLPALWPDDLLTIQSAPSDSIVPGDIALCLRDGRFFVHRVISKSTQAGRETLITRGDAQPGVDPCIFAESLLGRVVEVRRADRFIIPSRRWRQLHRLAGLALCHFDTVRGLALLYVARKAKSKLLPIALAAAASAGEQIL
jgi:hypothetical protein